MCVSPAHVYMYRMSECLVPSEVRVGIGHPETEVVNHHVGVGIGTRSSKEHMFLTAELSLRS